MNRSPRESIEVIYRRAVESVQPDRAIRSHVEFHSEDAVSIDNVKYEIPEAGIYLIALGKASIPMVRGLTEICSIEIAGGIAVTKQMSVEAPVGVRVIQGSHPVPDEKSLEAGAALVDFADQVPDGALVVCLISGGGSALAESLQPDITLDDLSSVTEQLLHGGANIHELNAVRSRLSRTKAGGLLSHLQQCKVVNLIISDVLGDPLSIIASGPTVPPEPGLDAEEIVERFGLDLTLPDAPVEPRQLVEPDSYVIGSIRIALHEALDAARDQGYQPALLTSRLQGEAREAAGFIATLALDAQTGDSALSDYSSLIFGGETTVTLRGNGVGGRNTEAALAAAIKLAGARGITIGFLATDGDDGNSGAAGGIVDGATISDRERLAAVTALDRNDSFTYLASVDAAHSPGATETNVNDLVIVLISEALNQPSP